MDFDSRLVLVVVVDVTNCICVDWSVLKFDAVGKLLHIVFSDVLVGPHLIDFFLHIFRVSQLRSQVAVVCEQKHASSVAVKASYRIDALLASVLDDVHHRETSVWIVACSDTVFRLVEQDIAFVFERNHLVVVFNHVVALDF